MKPRNKTLEELSDDVRKAVHEFLTVSDIAKKIDQSMLRLSRVLRKSFEREK